MHEGEFDEFYTASYRRLTSQLYAMIGDLDEAQDCVQAVDHPEAWVRTTAYRLAVSRWRRTQRALLSGPGNVSAVGDPTNIRDPCGSGRGAAAAA